MPHIGNAARFRFGLARHGPDAGAEHDLSGFALHLAGADRRDLISLGGVALGFVVYMLCAAFGITALVFVVPVRLRRAALRGGRLSPVSRLADGKPGGRSPFQVHALPKDGPRKLFAMGFVTNLLNPKIAMFYLSLLPQFIDPAQGSVLYQSLALGLLHISISITLNSMIAVTAGSISLFLLARPAWLVVQRWVMGSVLAGLAVKMAFEARRV